MPVLTHWPVRIIITITTTTTDITITTKPETAEKAAPNRIELSYGRGATWVNELSYESPLRIFEVGRSHGDAPSRLVLSNHGGGMLQGDRVDLDLRAGADTRGELRSQANTQILRNPSGKPSVFRVFGRVEPGAVMHFLGEPVVMHASGIYRQHMQWDLAAGARLVLVDWFQSGRSESGESFRFTSYESHLDVSLEGRPLLRERFRLAPGFGGLGNAGEDWGSARRPTVFAGCDHLISAYCLGDFPGELLETLPESANQQNIRTRPLRTGARKSSSPYSVPAEGPWFSVSPVPGGALIRALGKTRLDIEARFKELLEPFLFW